MLERLSPLTDRATLALTVRSRFMLVLLLCAQALSVEAAEPTANVEFFETKIRPVLVRSCYECHSAAIAEPKGGLRLDSREAIRRGGESGPAVVPGNLDQSLIVEVLRHESLKMPPDKKLSDAVIADFVTWIKLGAIDPRDRVPTAREAAEQSWQSIFAERRSWWSLQPLGNTAPSQVADRDWSHTAVDRFVRTQLDHVGLQPAALAEPATLARRLSFVLTGLPPTAETLAAANDYPALVDRLLDSPHFGERLARHWMDVVRYSDTYGYEWDNPARGAWRYRDYLIRAFNRDVGFDQLVREQLAGDLLDPPRIDAVAAINESQLGPMFYHLGEHRHGDSLEFNGVHQEMVNNKIDAVSKAFLATTVACARCHDHKLDAVSQRDYYALASVLMTPRWTARVVDLPERNAAAIEQLKQLRQSIQVELATHWQAVASRFADEVAVAMNDNGGMNDASAKSLTTDRLKLWQAALAAPADTKPNTLPDQPQLVAHRLAQAADDAESAKLWSELAARWSAAQQTRAAANASAFQVLTDFRAEGLPPGWTVEGDGLRHGYVRDGVPLVALAGDAAIGQLLPRGYHSHALSPRLPGSLRTPRLQTWGKTSLSMQIAGGDWAGHLTVVENAFQTERVVFIEQPQTMWQRFDTFTQHAAWNVRVELCTSDLNPNFPPRTGKARAGNVTLPARDYGDGKRSWFSITGIVIHDQVTAPQHTAPQDTLDRFAILYAGEPPQSKQAAWQRLGRWLSGAVERWSAAALSPDSLQSGDFEIVNWLLARQLLPNRHDLSPRLAELTSEYRRIEATLTPATTINGMDEREVIPAAYRLNVRGNVDELGEAVPRDFLEVFAGRHAVATSSGSGRRELAEFLVSRNHPLTARVYVNRVWSWIFGRGLVDTPDDFGHLGQLPTHPALLDHLAREFIADGWSTKRLVRRLVLSRTFRQSGQMSPRAREADPDNRWLHHYPTRRLEAEAVRDAMLAVSGRLDPALYGPTVDPFRAKEDDSKRLFTGPLDGLGRRSIYTRIAIMEPPKLLAVFNQPSPKIPTGKRDVTNVPTQALALLNDPFVAGQAEYCGASVVRGPQQTIVDRLREMFLRALGRLPTEDELRVWRVTAIGFAIDDPNQSLTSDKPVLASAQVWTQVAHLLFNTKEFIYYR